MPVRKTDFTAETQRTQRTGSFCLAAKRPQTGNLLSSKAGKESIFPEASAPMLYSNFKVRKGKNGEREICGCFRFDRAAERRRRTALPAKAPPQARILSYLDCRSEFLSPTKRCNQSNQKYDDFHWKESITTGVRRSKMRQSYSRSPRPAC